MMADYHHMQLLVMNIISNFFFFFQAEDGIRDTSVTGVQTCALPISAAGPEPAESSDEKRTQHSIVKFVGRSDGESAIWTNPFEPSQEKPFPMNAVMFEIGRASCRERV